MGKSTTQIGVWTISAIVLMRLAVGWHFYTEGIKKLEPGFTSAGLLQAAKGPLAPMYYSFLPNPSGYAERLATPKKYEPLTRNQADETTEWQVAYATRQKESIKAKELPLAEFPPHAPYTEWAEAVKTEWESKRDAAVKMAGGEEAAKEQAENAYRTRLQQLADFLAGEAGAIADFRHELWRIERMRDQPGAEEIDYREERIESKGAEIFRQARTWSTDVNLIEAAYVDDLAAIGGLTEKQNEIQEQLRPRSPLDWIDPTVTCVVTGVGVCMMLGFCTRLAGGVGIVFLLSVMASQPPWVAGADTKFLGYQLVELGAFMTLAAVGAGRWYGLDSVFRRICGACCGPKD